jgi:phage shock protein PspC (stress-responsive transcriptional regulator)
LEEEMVTTRRFYRSRHSKVLAGVAAGLGQYFNVDPVLFRLGFVLLALTPGAGVSIIAYILLAIAMPERPGDEPEPMITSSVSVGNGREIAGILLVGFGLLVLAGNMGLFNLVRWDLFWPLALIAAGAALVINRVR